MERKIYQLSFLNTLKADLGDCRTVEFFDKCDRLIPWDTLAEPLPDMYRNHTNKCKRFVHLP